MIYTDQKLEPALTKLKASPWIAVDTEADSLHAYPEKLCLLQISLPGEDILLDPLSRMDLTPAFKILATRELILHGADYDLRLLRKGFDFVPHRIFDTMLASRLLGCREFGLTHLVEKYLGVKLEKGPQKANWARRPLTARMETYARNDTRYLKPLAEILAAQLDQTQRLQWHQETCARLVADCAVLRLPDPDLVWRVKGSRKLRPHSLSVLREIWSWREAEAISANKPPYFILTPEAMVNLAAAAVDSVPVEQFFPRSFSQRRVQGVLAAVQRGLASPQSPSHLRAQSHRQSESEKLRLRKLEHQRDQQAAQLGIDPTLIANRATLILLAKDWGTHQKNLMAWQKNILKATAEAAEAE